MFERTTPTISIIIPSWFTDNQHGKYGKNETFWFADKCLERLLEVTSRKVFELIIIDNGSSLKDVKVEEYWAKADILVRNKTNLGFGPACNQGFNLARGKFICCLNNDVLVWKGWEKAILDTFNAKLDPPAGVVMPALMRETKDARDALDINEIDLSQNYGQYGVRAEFGSLWVMPKSIMDEIKLKDGFVFDEIFLLGMGEDRDLWKRVRLLGYETYRTHNTRVFHQGNLSIGKVPNRKEYTEKNRQLLRKKWGEN